MRVIVEAAQCHARAVAAQPARRRVVRRGGDPCDSRCGRPTTTSRVYTRFFDLIEAGDGDAASALMAEYFERHDAKLVGAVGAA